MLFVYQRLFVRIIDDAIADVSVQFGIGEPEIVLIGLAAETVSRRFFYKGVGEPEHPSYSLDFLNGEP